MKYLFILIMLFLVSCEKTESNEFIIDSIEWTHDGEFQLLNRFNMEADDNYCRYSEGAFLELDRNTILVVYTRFEGGVIDSTSASIVSMKSFDRGLTWSEEKVLVHNTDDILNVMSASLIRFENGDIGLFYLIKQSITNCYPVMAISKDNGNTFLPAQSIIESGNGYYVLNNSRVIKDRSGRIIIPLCEFENDGEKITNWKGKIFYMFSEDNGLTWKRSVYFKPCADDVTEQEPGIIELKDGSMLAYVRTNKGSQYFSRSNDGGITWSDFRESSLISPLSPATIFQINQGEKPLVAVWNNTISERKSLTISLSYDNGYTWENNCVIESEAFSSYPSILVFEDGEILLSFSYSYELAGGLQNYSINKLRYIQHAIISE